MKLHHVLALSFLTSILSACLTGNGPRPTPTPVLLPLSEPDAAQPGTPCVDSCSTAEPVDLPPPLRFVLPTPGAEPVSAWRPPLYPVPWALSEHDHFYFVRPISADQVNWPLADYRYGGVFFSKDVIHTGVDIPADPGTPIRAAGPGEVLWADWGFFSGVPGNIDDPYGISVVIAHDFGYNGEPLYTLYAHMQSTSVAKGQWVKTGDVLGRVGDTGYTTGPHLHFEVRVGQNSYYFTRNPELWIAPPQGWGVITGRIMKRNGNALTQFNFWVQSLEGGRRWQMRTYGPGPVNSDDYYHENFALSDLPAGPYEIQIEVDSKVRRQRVQVYAGGVTYFSYREEIGYSTDPPPTPEFNLPVISP
jgi:murein DD-endopeptidase MepM/ murein hydrolase activator NlpD